MTLSILIPTKNRGDALTYLLDSIRNLRELQTLKLEVIVADNDSADGTYARIESLIADFPVPLRVVRITQPGKSAALNAAARLAKHRYLAFFDDDVIVDANWLSAIRDFISARNDPVVQGRINLQSPDAEDPQIQMLMQRYRTIPTLFYDESVTEVRTINGANFVVDRLLFNRVGGFDERLGPGASGTSEDVDLAQQIVAAEQTIGYCRDAIVYHRVDRSRLTEQYFEQLHRRQGASRFWLKDRPLHYIYMDLVRSLTRYAVHALNGRERERYRAKGRVYHYLGMLEARRRASQS